MVCLTEKKGLLDKLPASVSYSAIGCEPTARESTVHIE